MSTLLTEDPDFEVEVLRTVLSDQSLFLGCYESLKPEFLLDASSQMLWGMAQDYYINYRSIPSKVVLRDQILVAFAASNDREKRQRQTLIDHIENLYRAPSAAPAYIAARLSQFLQGKALQQAVSETLDDLQAGKIDAQLIDRFKDALLAGTKKTDPGSLVIGSTEEMVRRETDPKWRPAVPTGLVHFDAEMGGGPREGELCMLMAPPKGFKCTHLDCQVMMYDGSVKTAKEVKLGDLLMGDDSTPRRVLELGRGRGQMFRVSQANGDTYIVTAEHQLVLKRPDKKVPQQSRYHTEQILEMTAEEYSKQKPWFKRIWQGYKASVEFPTKEVSVDPYYVGLWLGDGLNRGTGICSADDDHEVRSWLLSFATQLGLKVTEEHKTRTTKEGDKVRAKYSILHLNRREKGGSNHLIDSLRAVGLGGKNNKHVPDSYRINSRSVRLQVLAGMIDSDGHFLRVKGFIFNNSNRTLCDDACWLARSLGFRAHVVKIKSFYKKNGVKHYRNSFRTLIQGKVSEIPTKLPRKRGTDSVKVTDRTPIKVEPVGEKDWCGWRTDGNHRYLLGDFTVTHNSGTMLNFAFNGVKRGVGVNVLYVTLELSEHLQLLRFAVRTTMKTKYDMLRNPVGFIDYWGTRVRNIYQPGKNIVIKYFDAYKFTPKTLDDYLEMMQREHGIVFGMVVIDYLNLVGSEVKKEKDYLERVLVATDLRSVAHKWKFPLWTAARSNREEQSSNRPGMKHMAASFEWVGICDYCYAMRRYKKEGTLHLIPVASRNEGGNNRIICRCDPSYMYLASIGVEAMPEEDDEEENPRKRKQKDDEDGIEETAREIRKARKQQKEG